MKQHIEHTELGDLNFACRLYDEAIKYQQRKSYPEYRWDDREMQRKYIIQGTHYKVVIENEIAAIFNIHLSDPIIWREMDKGKSVYLHGVLINPKHKGKRLFGDILNWSIDYAKEYHKENIRLDTWYNNPDLLNYYLSFGFEEIENFQIPCKEDIPLNCRGNIVTLMEFQL